MPDGIVVNEHLTIPESEVQFRATRAGGPGGQHVNTSSTRVELVWHLRGSPSLDPEQRALLLQRLGRRLDSRGRLRIVASESRSQRRNRDTATERFRDLLAKALVLPPPRRQTKVPAAARRARLESKKRRGELKRLRRPPREE
jgi:ribosome-associated protein